MGFIKGTQIASTLYRATKFYGGKARDTKETGHGLQNHVVCKVTVTSAFFNQ